MIKDAKVCFVITSFLIIFFTFKTTYNFETVYIAFTEACIINSYEAQFISYDKGDMVRSLSVLKNINTKTSEKIPMNAVSKPVETSAIFFFYSTTDIRVESVEILVDFNSFISSVGGSLGLFLGFSFLGFLSHFYDCTKTLYRNLYM